MDDALALPRPTVVLCPPLGADPAPAWHAHLARALADDGLPVVAPAPVEQPRDVDPRLAVAGWVADQAVAITAAMPEAPVLLVATGHACRALPALGMAQRASRRAVVGYVLVDGPAPDGGRSGLDWPDAPVTVVSSVDQPHGTARLRGWSLVTGDPVVAVLEIARAWPDPPGSLRPGR